MAGKKKDKDKKVARKERAEAKMDKKNAKRLEKHGKKKVDMMDEEDIELILAQFKKKEQSKTEINVDDICDAPSGRLHATLVANPNKPDTELIFFGGEFWNGEHTYAYNDLYIYNHEKNTWKQIISPNTPPPRSSHQAVCYKHYMYIFGGEFTSPTQNQYYHYKDVWRLDTQTWKWEELKLKNGPPARSGHRMILWKRTLVMFGGFFDTLASKESKYFNDVWLLNELEGAPKWKKVEYKPGAEMPAPRSGCCMGLHGDTFFMYGGYSAERTGEYGATKGLVHTDGWTFGLNGLVWHKVKKSGIAPSQRSGCSMAVDRRRCIFFGGVWDFESKDDLNSTFYNDMYCFNMDNRRWFPLHIHPKKPKKEGRRAQRKQKQHKKDGEDPKSNDGEQADRKEEETTGGEDEGKLDKDKSEEVDIAEKQADGEAAGGEEGEEGVEGEEGESASSTPIKPKIPAAPMIDDDDDDDDDDTVDAPSSPTSSTTTATTTTTTADDDNKDNMMEENTGPAPCRRIHANLVIIGQYLYLYGGMYENGKIEITMNDLWKLNMHKLDVWEEVFNNTREEWKEEEDEEDEEEEDEEEEEDNKGKRRKQRDGDDEAEDDPDEEEEDEEEEDEEGEEGAPKKEKKKKAGAVAVKSKGRGKRTLREALLVSLEESAEGVPTPEINEALRQFFKRTMEFWVQEAQEISKEVGKTLRKDGFHLCQRRYMDVRPILAKLEDLERKQREEEEARKAFADKKAAELKELKRKEAQKKAQKKVRDD